MGRFNITKRSQNYNKKKNHFTFNLFDKDKKINKNLLPLKIQNEIKLIEEIKNKKGGKKKKKRKGTKRIKKRKGTKRIKKKKRKGKRKGKRK